MTETDDFIFTVKNLKKSFGSKQVLQGIDLDVRRGEILGVLGKSGSGKSTMMNIVIGAIKKYEGDVSFYLSTGVKSSLHEAKKQIGFSFQPYSAYDELTLKENLYYFGKLYGLDKKTIDKRTVELFHLTDLDVSDLHLTIRELSGGMKKRFDIVVSLLHNPSILILDEPTAGLDPLRRKHILNIMKRINNKGVTILITSHIMSDIDGVVDRVLIIDKGRTVLLDAPQKIKNELLENEQILIESSPGVYDDIVKHLMAFSVLHCEVKNKELVVVTPESEIILHYLLHLFDQENEVIERITITEPDLSEVFEKLDSLGEPQVLQENIKKLNEFIEILIGKNYPTEKIKEIMATHNWPEEITSALLDRHVVKRVKK